MVSSRSTSLSSLSSRQTTEGTHPLMWADTVKGSADCTGECVVMCCALEHSNSTACSEHSTPKRPARTPETWASTAASPPAGSVSKTAQGATHFRRGNDFLAAQDLERHGLPAPRRHYSGTHDPVQADGTVCKAWVPEMLIQTISEGRQRELQDLPHMICPAPTVGVQSQEKRDDAAVSEQTSPIWPGDGHNHNGVWPQSPPATSWPHQLCVFSHNVKTLAFGRQIMAWIMERRADRQFGFSSAPADSSLCESRRGPDGNKEVGRGAARQKMISAVLMLATVALLAHLRGGSHSDLLQDQELSFVAPESAPEQRSRAGQTTMMPRPTAATPPKQASMGIVDDGTGILAVAEDRRNEAAAMERKQMLVLESQVRTAQESLMQIKQKRRGRMLMHLAKASGLAAAAMATFVVSPLVAIFLC